MNNEERYSKPVVGRVFTLRERKDSPRIDSLARAYRDVFIRTTPKYSRRIISYLDGPFFVLFLLFLSKERGKRDFINLAREFSLAVWGMNT